MRLLLDTHVAIWAITDDARLTPKARALIEAPANAVVVSVASVWEITIKYAQARGRVTDMQVPGADALGYFRGAGFEILPISPEHVLEVANLPAHLSDPFDRLLIAQANIETLRLLTSDRQVVSYGGGVMLI